MIEIETKQSVLNGTPDYTGGSRLNHDATCPCNLCNAHRAAAKIGDAIAQRATERHAKVSAATQREQENRSRLARALAGTMRARGVTAGDARTALMGAVTKTQRAAERLARQAAAQAAGCRVGYVPSDETCAEAVRLLEFAEEVAK